MSIPAKKSMKKCAPALEPAARGLAPRPDRFRTPVRHRPKSPEKIPPRALHTYTNSMYIYSSAVSGWKPRFRFARKRQPAQMKLQRHNAIRELLTSSLVTNQDELRRKLRRRGFAVTQATLSRDLHELHLFKGPGGYALSNGNGSPAPPVDDGPPSVAEVIASFGMRVRSAMNQVVVGTVMGGAQPVAAALDQEAWPQVVGTIAGDDTVLVICPDQRRAAEVEARLRTLLES
jgi:transcriptional regulator of arginine metabolism